MTDSIYRGDVAGVMPQLKDLTHSNLRERVREDMASAITALDFLATSIGQLGALHVSDEEEAILTEGRVIAAKREVVREVSGLLEAGNDNA